MPDFVRNTLHRDPSRHFVNRKSASSSKTGLQICARALLRLNLRVFLRTRRVARGAEKPASLSLEQIGAYFGGRDHSTVLHACRKVEQALTNDISISGAVRELRADLA